MKESQRLFWSPQFKLGRTKSIFCSLKFCWGPNTLGPPRIIVLSPQIQFTNSVNKHKCRPFKQRSSRNGLFVYKIGEFNMIYELLSLIPFVAIYALLGGPALTKSSWLGDRNQFIEPGAGFRYLFSCMNMSSVQVSKLIGTIIHLYGSNYCVFSHNFLNVNGNEILQNMD